jgi:ATP adenylyltransferase
MNLYPYNSGHLMIVPYTHVPALKDLDDETKLECMKLIDLGIEALEKSIYPQGYNIGVNIGKCSGAGIDEHVHFHIVPRWSGDTNFMPVLNDVKLVSQAMEDTYGKLQAALEKIIGK